MHNVRSPRTDRAAVLVAATLLVGWAVLAFTEGLTWWNVLSLVGLLSVGVPALTREVSRRRHVRRDGGTSDVRSA